MQRLVPILLGQAVLGAAAVLGGLQEQANSPAAPPGIDWSAFLIHDAAVQAELKLNEAQDKAINELMDGVLGQLWNLRFMPAADATAESVDLAEKVRAKLAEVLTAEQQQRLAQVTLQNRWPASLLEPEVVERLALSGVQRSRIASIVERTQRSFRELEKLGQRQDLHEAAAQKIRAQQSKDVQAVLTGAQKKQWSTLTGARFDFARVGPMRALAPELVPGGEWINSKPLTLAELRGTVVVVHFWTFGCGNCINNYAAYRAWQKTYAGKGVTLIGIHTPETDGERVVESIRAKAKANELTFPIVVDNDKKNWNAWANDIWPAVYLIDKQGRVRYWWYGELNWQGKGGEKYMTDRIEELRAEKP